MSRDGWAFPVRIAKGMKDAVPQWYFDGAPRLCAGSQVYIDAFWELSTERSFGDYLGPIPWSKIRLYAADLNLNRAVTTMFTLVIRELDEHYQDFTAKNKNK